MIIMAITAAIEPFSVVVDVGFLVVFFFFFFCRFFVVVVF